MQDPQSSRFWQATILSGLMDAQGLAACWDAIPAAKREIAEHLDRRLARQAVQSNALTLWQAQQLLAGRTGGFKVDRYILLDLIGQGGMGRVYLARDTRLSRRVALKILSPERINNPRAIALFQREARVGAQLQHENLVRIYDFGESSGRFYLVMEYIEGKTIGSLISEQGPMPAATAARLVRQIACGLEHIHRKGLIHRDVNPYNILVTHDGTAKLADLGLAINLADEDRVTRDGATVGTFDYVAPEQARHSHAADIRSDIYSLGCSLYHMITGQVPFPGSSLPEKLFSHQAITPTSISELSPGLPEGLADIVRKMMEKSPDERFATPMQVAQALEPYCEDYAGGAAEEGTSRISRPATAQSVTPASVTEQAHAGGAEAQLGLIELAPGAADPPDPAAAASAGGEAVAVPVHAAAVLQTMDDGSGETDVVTPLVVDLGIEPSQRGEAVDNQVPSVMDDTLTSAANRSVHRPGARAWVWGMSALTVIVAVGFGLVLVTRSPVRDPAPAVKIRSVVSPFAPPEPGATRRSGAPVEAANSSSKPLPDIVVRTEDDEFIPAANLYEAIQAAMANRGWVELRNSEPIRLTSDQKAPLSFGQGWGPIIIRAAPQTRPVIDVAFNATAPLLETGSAVSLEISGLTFVAHYPAQVNATASVAPVIVAAGKRTRIERCAFKVARGSQPRNSRAIVAQGSALEVDRSWFEGFGTAIDIDAVVKISARIRQTIFVPALEPVPADSQVQPAELFGWGVKVQVSTAGRSPSSKTESHLYLDHDTLAGAGFLDLTGRPISSPLQIDVSQCAIRANSLLAWKPSRPGESLTDQVHWLGTGNQYDIQGAAWILSGAERSSQPSAPVTDLESWLRIAGSDKEAIPTRLEFVAGPGRSSDSLLPGDFAIRRTGASAPAPGADPELVGPWSSR